MGRGGRLSNRFWEIEFRLPRVEFLFLFFFFFFFLPPVVVPEEDREEKEDTDSDDGGVPLDWVSGFGFLLVGFEEEEEEDVVAYRCCCRCCVLVVTNDEWRTLLPPLVVVVVNAHTIQEVAVRSRNDAIIVLLLRACIDRRIVYRIVTTSCFYLRYKLLCLFVVAT